MNKQISRFGVLWQNFSKNKTRKFLLFFIVLFFLLDNINLYFYSATSAQGNYFNPFIFKYCNYIQWIKSSLIFCSVGILKIFGLSVIYNNYQILAYSGTVVNINYSCLGLQLISFFTAFVLSFPLKKKGIFYLSGLLLIYLLNIIRITAITYILYKFPHQRINFNFHHEIYNIVVYLCLFIFIYLWIKPQNKK